MTASSSPGPKPEASSSSGPKPEASSSPDPTTGASPPAAPKTEASPTPHRLAPAAASQPRTPAQWPPLPAGPPAAPAPPSVLRQRWPGPAGGAPWPVIGAVAGAAVVAATSIPLDRAGVGWLVSVIAGTAALGIALRRTAAPSPVRSGNTGEPDRAPTKLDRLGIARLVWVAATVALVGVGTVRAAGWLFVLCLLTAGLTACLAVADGRSLTGLLLAAVIPPASVFRSVPWAITGLRRDGRPARAGLGRGLATGAVSLGLLVVFGALFASADAVFADLLDGLLPQLSAGSVVRWTFVFVAVGAGLLGAAFVLAAPPDLTGLDRRSSRRLRRLEWAVPVALLDALFAAFVLVQVTTLFGGSAHVLRTAGLTYADYARSGFWQLLAVTVLTLLVIAGASRWAPRQTPAERWLIRLLLGTLALLSLIVVSSALYRMNVYTQAYGATRLRLLVTVCEFWLGLVFVLILVAGVRLRAAWLPRLILGAAVLALLGLALANPDRLIAERNIDRYAETGRLDLDYLSRLSADAVPTLDRLPGQLRACALDQLANDLADDPDDWRGANLGRRTARELLGAVPVSGATSNCSGLG